MSGDMIMIPSLNDRLGMKGYTFVARAPGVGLPQFADGSWHVVGGSDPTMPEQMHEIDQTLIPFILSKGGDIVLYRLSDDGEAKPVLSRGGMAGRPPQLDSVHAYDPAVLSGLSELHALGSKPVSATRPVQAEPRYDRRLVACIAAGFALLLGSTAYVVGPNLLRPAPTPGRWVPDMSNPRDAALAKGATVMAVPSENDPEMMVYYRLYPSAYGKTAKREVIGTFRKSDLDTWEGRLPDSHLEWRTRF